MASTKRNANRPGKHSGSPSKKVASHRDVNNVLRQTKITKCKTDERNKGLNKYEFEFGLTPARINMNVIQASCRFCQTFGREERPQVTVFDALISKRCRANRTTTQHFTKFRTDNIQKHMENQHPKKWAEYVALRDNLAPPEELRSFFAVKKEIDPFLTAGSSVQVWVPNGIASVIRRLLSNEPEHSQSYIVSDDYIGPVRFSDDFIDTEDGFLIEIEKRKQFDTIIQCINTSSSFRAVARLFVIFGEATGNMSLGKPNEKMIGRCIRHLVAINLCALRHIMRKTWAFSIMADGASHDSEGYLDVRMSFGFNGQLHNYHLLAIPMQDRSHSGFNYSDLVLDVMKNVFDDSILNKLIGITSDGSHQLNLLVDEFLEAFDEIAAFRSTLGSEITFTRKFDTVRSVVGKCPTYATTRWESIHHTCKFMAEKYEQLMECHEGKTYNKPSSTWWLCLFVLADLTKAIKKCFKKMQYQNVTKHAQYRALTKLATTFQMQFEEDSDGTEPIVSRTKVSDFIKMASYSSEDMYNELPLAIQDQVVLGMVHAIARFIVGVKNLSIEVNYDDAPSPTILPAELPDLKPSAIRDLIRLHEERLKAAFGDTATTVSWTEYQNFLRRSKSDSAFKRLLDSSKRERFEGAWRQVDPERKYWHLIKFLAAFAAVSPGTHQVEGDFSDLKRIKGQHRSCLSNYAMEGQLQAKQYFALISLANDIGYQDAINEESTEDPDE
ncbi:hypothetical protein Poli38472_009049 [Pythium oligandrum]|uniref:Uncharacterized protein n=1 Tax=Pythium oligandrum TaxID=41045 RepID=A0A8K1CK07_PYTOL|nr:hypothetical protein Poli38472_009049 [Pythium oligandrum]|eukprot:TMW64882.1 hypothetical protein Poli38472_009049 [Pythium oligandrum]